MPVIEAGFMDYAQLQEFADARGWSYLYSEMSPNTAGDYDSGYVTLYYHYFIDSAAEAARVEAARIAEAERIRQAEIAAAAEWGRVQELARLEAERRYQIEEAARVALVQREQAERAAEAERQRQIVIAQENERQRQIAAEAERVRQAELEAARRALEAKASYERAMSTQSIYRLNTPGWMPLDQIEEYAAPRNLIYIGADRTDNAYIDAEENSRTMYHYFFAPRDSLVRWKDNEYKALGFTVFEIRAEDDREIPVRWQLQVTHPLEALGWRAYITAPERITWSPERGWLIPPSAEYYADSPPVPEGFDLLDFTIRAVAMAGLSFGFAAAFSQVFAGLQAAGYVPDQITRAVEAFQSAKSSVTGAISDFASPLTDAIKDFVPVPGITDSAGGWIPDFSDTLSETITQPDATMFEDFSWGDEYFGSSDPYFGADEVYAYQDAPVFDYGNGGDIWDMPLEEFGSVPASPVVIETATDVISSGEDTFGTDDPWGASVGDAARDVLQSSPGPSILDRIPFGQIGDKIIQTGASAAVREVISAVTGQPTRTPLTIPPGARIVTLPGGGQVLVDQYGRPLANTPGQNVRVNPLTGRPEVLLPSGRSVALNPDGTAPQSSTMKVALIAGAALAVGAIVARR